MHPNIWVLAFDTDIGILIICQMALQNITPVNGLPVARGWLEQQEAEI